MKVNLAILINAYSALERLASLYLTGKLNFRNSRTLDDARKLKKSYDEASLAALEKHKAIPLGGDQWSFPNVAAKEAFNADLQAILDEEVEIYGEPYELQLDSFDGSQLSGAQMLALDKLGLVVFVEEDDKEAAPKEKPAKAKAARK